MLRTLLGIQYQNATKFWLPWWPEIRLLLGLCPEQYVQLRSPHDKSAAVEDAHVRAAPLSSQPLAGDDAMIAFFVAILGIWSKG